MVLSRIVCRGGSVTEITRQVPIYSRRYTELVLKQANACLSKLDFGRATATGPAMLGRYFLNLFVLSFFPMARWLLR